MKSLKQIVVLTLLGSFFMLSACHKDKNTDVVYTKYGLDLSGANEAPVNASKASGLMAVSYNKDLKALTFNLEWANLTGAPIGSHIHGPAPKGANAGIKYDFTALIPKTTSGVFNHSVYVDGVIINEESLLKGLYYINIHTPTYPGGEIRSQIVLK